MIDREDINDAYDLIYDGINYLLEQDVSGDEIFDCIVDHFAYKAEEAMRIERGYSRLLNRMRSDVLSDIPEASDDDLETDAFELHGKLEDVNLDDVDLTPRNHTSLPADLFGNMQDLNRSMMSGDPDKFLEFVNRINFPGNIDE